MAQQQPAYVRMQDPVTSVTQPQTVQRSRGYKALAGRSTGGIQIACGVLSIIFGLTVAIYSWNQSVPGVPVVGWPIWGGVLYVVTGSLGVPTRQGKLCLISAYMVMSILSAICAAGQLIWESIRAVATIIICYHYNNCYQNTRYNTQVAFGLNLASLLVALVETIVAIVGSAYCCHGVCTTNKNTSFVVQYNPQMQQQTGQIYSQQQVASAQYQLLPGAPAQYQPQGAPMQYQVTEAAAEQYPQGAHAQYPPQGATEHDPEKGAPPVYNESAPQDKTD